MEFTPLGLGNSVLGGIIKLATFGTGDLIEVKVVKLEPNEGKIGLSLVKVLEKGKEQPPSAIPPTATAATPPSSAPPAGGATEGKPPAPTA